MVAVTAYSSTGTFQRRYHCVDSVQSLRRSRAALNLLRVSNYVSKYIFFLKSITNDTPQGRERRRSSSTGLPPLHKKEGEKMRYGFSVIARDRT